LPLFLVTKLFGALNCAIRISGDIQILQNVLCHALRRRWTAAASKRDSNTPDYSGLRYPALELGRRTFDQKNVIEWVRQSRGPRGIPGRERRAGRMVSQNRFRQESSLCVTRTDAAVKVPPQIRLTRRGRATRSRKGRCSRGAECNREI
jgi:hypothetical protein